LGYAKEWGTTDGHKRVSFLDSREDMEALLQDDTLSAGNINGYQDLGNYRF
jgi:hypothetical protein